MKLKNYLRDLDFKYRNRKYDGHKVFQMKEMK